ncbi:hypothetical protein EVAR_2780_1 [Eumeta japonica]|uniref:Uncharacterized protein n=1 Tax=Eumeta variegata TaxID=151549 RepID=A0A4C1T325_EUMVA|nr:hypothetical protein EVAR_2780_1 [Eumeta japonica]
MRVKGKGAHYRGMQPVLIAFATRCAPNRAGAAPTRPRRLHAPSRYHTGLARLRRAENAPTIMSGLINWRGSRSKSAPLFHVSRCLRFCRGVARRAGAGFDGARPEGARDEAGVTGSADRYHWRASRLRPWGLSPHLRSALTAAGARRSPGSRSGNAKREPGINRLHGCRRKLVLLAFSPAAARPPPASRLLTRYYSRVSSIVAAARAAPYLAIRVITGRYLAHRIASIVSACAISSPAAPGPPNSTPPISSRYCQCEVGVRTVGCCARVAVLLYLGHKRCVDEEEHAIHQSGYIVDATTSPWSERDETDENESIVRKSAPAPAARSRTSARASPCQPPPRRGLIIEMSSLIVPLHYIHLPRQVHRRSALFHIVTTIILCRGGNSVRSAQRYMTLFVRKDVK